MSREDTRFLQHSKVTLALHTLRAAEGPALLLLHGLGEASPTVLPSAFESWPGSVHALDFTGHGQSTLSCGGGYTAELLMADTDAAIAELGPCTLCGRGLGAYVALLAAGGRPEQVAGAILCDGPGIEGGGPTPSGHLILQPHPNAPAPPDPFALIELARDLRPPDYATAFVRQAVHAADAAPTTRSACASETPITVVARQRPEWLEQVLREPGVRCTSLAQALVDYGEVPAQEASGG